MIFFFTLCLFVRLKLFILNDISIHYKLYNKNVSFFVHLYI